MLGPVGVTTKEEVVVVEEKQPEKAIKSTIVRKKKAIEYLGGKCSRCGYNNHYAAMQFHHVEKKDFAWNKLRLLNWERTKEELDKCVLLCANCHAIVHSLNP